MRRPILIASLGLAAISGACSAAGILSVPLNLGVRVGLSGEARSVVVGNPLIADVNVTDTRSLVIVGKAPGVTNIIVIARDGRTLMNQTISVQNALDSQVSVLRGAEESQYSCGQTCSLLKPAAETATPSPPPPVN